MCVRMPLKYTYTHSYIHIHTHVAACGFHAQRRHLYTWPHCGGPAPPFPCALCSHPCPLPHPPPPPPPKGSPTTPPVMRTSSDRTFEDFVPKTSQFWHASDHRYTLLSAGGCHALLPDSGQCFCSIAAKAVVHPRPHRHQNCRIHRH
jgi:hypothetical protein